MEPALRGTAVGAFLGIFGTASANERVTYKFNKDRLNRTTRSQTVVISPAFLAIEVTRCITSVFIEKKQKEEHGDR